MISKEILTTLIQIQTDDGDQITSNIGPLGPRSTQYKTSNTVDDVCFLMSGSKLICWVQSINLSAISIIIDDVTNELTFQFYFSVCGSVSSYWMMS